jgi:hypothetical protein
MPGSLSNAIQRVQAHPTVVSGGHTTLEFAPGQGSQNHVSGTASKPKHRKVNWSLLGIETFLGTTLGSTLVGYAWWRRQSDVLNGVHLHGLGRLFESKRAGGLSIQDSTTNLMTSINSGVRIFYAWLTRQHAFETTGYEGLNRVGTYQVMRLTKDAERSPLSLARLGLSSLMKSREIIRINDRRNKEPWGIRRFMEWVDINWQNHVKNRMQHVAGLNTPFEVMVKGMKEPPKNPGDLKHASIAALRNRLTLQPLEEHIFDAMEQAEGAFKTHDAAQHSFETLLATPGYEASELHRAYVAYATAQYDVNTTLYPLDTLHWRGERSREAYRRACQHLNVEVPNLSGKPLLLHNALNKVSLAEEVSRQQANAGNSHLPEFTRHPDVSVPAATAQVKDNLAKEPAFATATKTENATNNDWHTSLREVPLNWSQALTQVAHREVKQQYELLRHDLKCTYLKKEVKDVFNSLLQDTDGKTSVHKQLPAWIDEVLRPYMREATKYYNPDYFNPHTPSPPQTGRYMHMLSDDYIAKVCKYIILKLPYVTQMGEDTGPKAVKKLKALAGKELDQWLEFTHEVYSDYAKEKMGHSVRAMQKNLSAGISDYVLTREKEPNARLGYYVSQAFQKGRQFNPNTQTFEGEHFDEVNVIFQLNRRMDDLDQYTRNRNIKLATEIAFQTAVSAFILGNVLFFIVYNTFARLDPDYQGEGKLELAAVLQKARQAMGDKTAAPVASINEKLQKPIEAHVNISVNFKPPLLHYGKHFNAPASASPDAATPVKEPMSPVPVVEPRFSVPAPLQVRVKPGERLATLPSVPEMKEAPRS